MTKAFEFMSRREILTAKIYLAVTTKAKQSVLLHKYISRVSVSETGLSDLDFARSETFAHSQRGIPFAYLINKADR